MMVLTQYQGDKIADYINSGWHSIFRAQDRNISCLDSKCFTPGEFRGTADAVCKALSSMRRLPEYVFVLASDHIYQMNYHDMLSFHKKHGMTASVGCIACPRHQARRFGILKTDFTSPISSFHEKPASLDNIVTADEKLYASMGIYVFSTKRLLDYLVKNQCDPSHDFGMDILPAMVRKKDIWAFPFVDDNGCRAYWRDVGDLAAYWEASLEQINDPTNCLQHTSEPEMEKIPLFRDHYVKLQISGHRKIINSKIADSVDIDEAFIENSIICPGARIENGATVRRSVVMDGAVIKGDSCVIDAVVQPYKEICGSTVGWGACP
jgi:glucose-1-phosphate adenylyltransferase